MKASDLLKLDRPPQILISGRAGSGKTALVSQIAGGYLFDFDQGMMSAAKLKDKFFGLRNLVVFDEYKDANPENPIMWEKAKKKIVKFNMLALKDKLKWDAIAIDSLTGMAQAIYYYVLHIVHRKKPEIQDWGFMVREMIDALTLLRGTKRLLLVTAHQAPIEIDGADILFPASITKNHSVKGICWLFDEVWTAECQNKPQDKIDYAVSGRATNSVTARTRSGFHRRLVHNEIGLKGVLEEIGYHYQPKLKKETVDASSKS